MFLKSFIYRASDWKLSDVSFGPTNLVVGKNATGKSRLIKELYDVIGIITQQKDIDDGFDFENKFRKLVFDDEGMEIVYEFSTSGKNVSSESLTVDGISMIERNSDSAAIKGEAINPPKNRLVLQTRRDTVLYPNIEKIIIWAENACMFRFIELNHDWDKKRLSMNREEATLYDIVKSFSDESRERVIDVANKLDFKIKGITMLDQLKALFFVEEGVATPLWSDNMSNGMFRTLSLLIYLEHMRAGSSTSILLIDDLGEGLDYVRATDLGRFVFDFCDKSGIQLAATTNDEFLMNIVDMSKWNILHRKGIDVNAVNAANNPELFDSFKFIGLNNFDIFTSDLIERGIPGAKNGD